MNSWDVIIAGAGIIGVSTALELRERGAKVLLLDRSQPGREASSAAAGMLAAFDPETPAGLREFARACARMYPDFVRKIEQASGMPVDFRQHGAITVENDFLHETPPPEYRPLHPGQLLQLESRLNVHGRKAYFVPEGCVDPDLLMQAAVRAAELAGVELKSSVVMHGMRVRGGSSEAEVVTSVATFAAKAAINCCGSWSGRPVKPRKGHMLYVQPKQVGLLQHVFRAADSYIVPRSSGKILLGTTVEDAGFDKTVEPATIQKLHAAAAQYIPELGGAQVLSSWTGLRPGTPDDLPLMGETGTPGVFIASGHFRNGVLLAPLTARIMANLATGKAAGWDIGPFSPLRFALK